MIKDIPGGAAGPRGATGAGEISAVTGWPVYLNVIERRFTDALQAIEKNVVNGIVRIFSSLLGASPSGCWRESVKQPNPREKKRCL